MSWVIERAHPDIRSLQAYQHAAWEPSLTRMHANELPWRVTGDESAAGLNRYPEPQPPALVQGLARLYGVTPAQVLVGRGSDEAIDLLVRVFCRAGTDNVIVCPPTFGMFSVAARIQGAAVVTVPLLAREDFALDVKSILERVNENTKLVFVCSPNNPTANAVPTQVLVDLCAGLAPTALLVVDEAYVEFSTGPSLAARLSTLPNLAILRTLSKAHGLAGARCGALLAAPEIIALARKCIPPYAITELTVEAVAPLLQEGGIAATKARVERLLNERGRLANALAANERITRVRPSQSNFLLVDCKDPDEVLSLSRRAGLLIRDVRQGALPNSLRISVGTPEENDRLLESLR
jgi:histidinol-phosphate aminotransferase